MWFTVKDKAIPIADLVLTDNLATYHNTISFTTVTKIYASEGVIETDFSKKFEVCITSQTRMQGDKMKVDCVTKKVHDAFNSTTAGYTGRTTVDGLFAKLGFNYSSNFQSNNTYFSIPQGMVTSLFDNLTKYASFANGGGAHFYMAYDGTVHGFDYKLIKEKYKAAILDCSILSEQIRTDWCDYTPSEFDIFYWDNNNKFKTETLTLEKGFGKAVVHINDTTGVWRDAAKQELTNTFYNKWFSGHTITVSTTLGIFPPLGTLVRFRESPMTYIVKAVSNAYNELQEVPTTTVILISEPTFV
jgi:hypothetical protein